MYLLELNFANIGENFIISCINTLRVYTSLQTLKIIGNDIGENGARTLTNALKVNTSLQKLTLCENNIGENMMKNIHLISIKRT